MLDFLFDLGEGGFSMGEFSKGLIGKKIILGLGSKMDLGVLVLGFTGAPMTSF